MCEYNFAVVREKFTIRFRYRLRIRCFSFVLRAIPVMEVLDRVERSRCGLRFLPECAFIVIAFDYTACLLNISGLAKYGATEL